MNQSNEIKTVEVRISDDDTRSVEYTLEVRPEETKIHIRLDTGQVVSEIFGPDNLDLIGERAKSVVADIARLHYGADD